MIRSLLFAIWIAAVSLGASSGGSYAVKSGLLARWRAASAPAIETRKTRQIQAPVLSQGEIKGYVVAQFSYTADATALARVSTSPDAFLLDEALRFLYARSDGELRDVMRVDLQKLAADLRERVNGRLETPIVKDIVVNELTYLTKDQVKRQ